jgi:transmembrane 9 superfamily protein 2/4
MLEKKSCEKLCDSPLNQEQLEFLQNRIKEKYGHNWLIDDLPVVYNPLAAGANPETETDSISLGFPLGERKMSEGPQLLNNHFDITIHYHTTKSSFHRVVKAEVNPRSIERKDGAEIKCPDDSSPFHLSEESKKSLIYTYSVNWKHSEISWATRWDSYLKVTNSAVHWFSLINSSVIVLFLSGMIAMILFRTLYRDIAKYNQIDAQVN